MLNSFLFMSFVVCLSYGASLSKPFSENDVDAYLYKYGYMDAKDSNFRSRVDEKSRGSERPPAPGIDDVRKNAIKKFQKFVGLTVTGELDGETLDKMNQPRCGVPDVAFPDPDTDGPAEFTVAGPKWDKQDLTWKLITPSRKLNLGTQRKAIQEAFQHWAAVAPLTMTETEAEPDIEILFVRGDHGDSYPFDGKGDTLAHAFYPYPSSIGGDTHFDEDEDWVYHSSDGAELEQAAAHEFGHALGLAHSTQQGALMFPYYRQYTPDRPMLHPDDIIGIQSIYGSGPALPKSFTTTKLTTTEKTTTATTTARTTQKHVTTHKPTTSTTKTSPVTSSQPVMSLCNVSHFDAMTEGPDGATYVFAKALVFRIDDKGLSPGFPKSTHQVFLGKPEAPLHVKAAVLHLGTNEMFLFNHHNKLWRYKDFQLQSLHTLSDKPFRAAVSFPVREHHNRVFVFGETYMSEFEPTSRMFSSWTLPISNFFRGIPSDITASATRGDNLYFFTQDKRYARIDAKTRSPSDQNMDLETQLWLETLCVQPLK